MSSDSSNVSAVKFWDGRYGSTGDFVYGTAPNDFLAETAEKYLPPNGEVVCLAEGEGRNAVFLAQKNFLVTAVDLSAEGLKKMDKLAEAKEVSVASVVCDLAEYDFPSAGVDGVISIWCHVPPELRRVLHRKTVEALRPGGVLILESYHPRQLELKTGGPPDARLMMTMEGLKEELKGLEFVIGREIERVIHEGASHSGKSAVTQVVARKPNVRR